MHRHIQQGRQGELPPALELWIPVHSCPFAVGEPLSLFSVSSCNKISDNPCSSVVENSASLCALGVKSLIFHVNSRFSRFKTFFIFFEGWTVFVLPPMRQFSP